METGKLDIIEKVLNSDLAEKTYNDALATPIKEISKILTWFVKSAQLLCLPFQFGAALQARIERRLKDVVENVPEEERVIPPESISIPIINKLAYIEDGNPLVKLYQNLLARAISKSKCSQAHPGFIAVIEQISPDEALLLYDLNIKQFSFTRKFDLNRETRKFENMQMLNNEFVTSKLVFSDNFDMYISHLESLDIICVTNKDSTPVVEEGIQVGSIEKYTMGFTQYGKLFISACFSIGSI